MAILAVSSLVQGLRPWQPASFRSPFVAAQVGAFLPFGYAENRAAWPPFAQLEFVALTWSGSIALVFACVTDAHNAGKDQLSWLKRRIDS